MLHASATDICEKLYFATGAKEIDEHKALYFSPSVQGYNAMLPNENGDESILNLETLFNGTLSNPQQIKALFETEKSQLNN